MTWSDICGILQCYQ